MLNSRQFYLVILFYINNSKQMNIQRFININNVYSYYIHMQDSFRKCIVRKKSKKNLS
jgi:hypothetical protein